VTALLPADASAEVALETTNGRVKSEFPVAVSHGEPALAARHARRRRGARGARDGQRLGHARPALTAPGAGAAPRNAAPRPPVSLRGPAPPSHSEEGCA
jgi:hypothetical protein